MKINGRKIEGPAIETVVFPRGDSAPIVFKVSAVLDNDGFKKLCPYPTPPKKMLKGGQQVEDVEHPSFRSELERWATLRSRWTILQSLKATEGLEWETVDLSDPNTWENLFSELESSGFNDTECSYLIQKIMEINCLNQSHLEEARARFLAGQLVKVSESSSHQPEPKSTPSGVLVNDGGSSLQG